MVRGFDTWNVPLHRSLNSMPPRTHWSGLRNEAQASSVSQHLALPSTDFVLTSNAEDASVNIWATRAGLTRVFGLNFKLQACIDPAGSLKRAQLHFLSYDAEEVGQGVKIYRRGPPQEKIEAQQQSQDVKQVEVVEEKEKGDGELMQAMFDESAAIDAACPETEASHSATLCWPDDLQAEYEQAEDKQDSSFIEDVYAADELSEELQKQASEKREEEKKQAKADKKKTDLNVLDKAVSMSMKKGGLSAKKGAAKEEKTVVEEKPVEPNLEFLWQLKDMGFPEDLGRKALVKVKNESVAAAVEAVVALQAEQVAEQPKQEPAKEAAKKATVAQWNCDMCTIINQPGGTSCHICLSPAPASAYVDVAAEQQKREEEELRQQQEVERVAKEKELEEATKRLEEQARAEEERLKAEVHREFQKTKRILEQATVVGFLFGTIRKAQDRRPLFVGAVMNNSEECTTDLHIRCLEYRKQYLANFMSAPNHAGAVESRLTKERFASETACLDSLMTNNQLLLESLHPALGDQHDASHSLNKVLGSAEMGVVRLPLKEVAVVCQMGTDVSPGKPLQVLVIGQREDSTTAVYMVSLEHAATATGPAEVQLGVTQLQSELFQKVPNSEIKAVRFCSKTGQLVVHTAADIATYSFSATEGSFAAERQSTLVAHGAGVETIKVEHGQAFVRENESVTAFSLESSPTSDSGASTQQIDSQESSLKEKEEQPGETRPSVDPEQVTVEDIKRYEALMKGKAVSAASNAHALRGRVEGPDSSQPMFKRHSWVANGEDEFGPMQVRFESAANLISLNIDLTFSCSNPAELLAERESQAEIVAESSLVAEDPAKAESVSATPKQDDALRHLGQFTIKGVDALLPAEDAGAPVWSQQAQPNSASPKDESAHYLPLIVHKHKGAQFNSSHQVNTIVLDNSQVFASNYARPEFYFKHLHGETMTIDKFTIRSQLASRCGAYPVGRGLLFMADSLESFEMTRPFHKFTAEDFSQWKQARMQDPRPLRPCEPVAFFEFDERPSLTVDIDFKRSCRYIMLKPTGFRSKPHHFRQSVNDLPMELEFFGALGSSQPFDASAEFCGSNALGGSGRQGEKPLMSGHAVVIHDLDTGEELLRLDDVQISQLRLCNLPLDSSRALGASGVRPIGQAVLRVSDPRVSLRTLGGLSVRVLRGTSEGAWQLRGTSVVGVITQAGQLPALDRSFLISPKYFGVINRVLARMVFDGKFEKGLTAYIMEFLTKLVKHDFEFAALILETLDLRKFVEVNLYSNDAAHIQASVEFLRCFQTERRFVRDLYEILIDIVQNVLPNSVPPQRGYEALIGMLNWVMPLDLERALRVLVDTFYSKVCKQCMPAVQSPEYIDFRTRFTAAVS